MLCSKILPPYTPYDLPDLTGIRPLAAPAVPNLGVQVLQGEDYTLLSLTNLSPIKETMEAKLTVTIPFTTAEFTSPYGRKDITVQGEEITVHNMADGGILILR